MELIFYRREDVAEQKASHIALYQAAHEPSLKLTLIAAFGPLVVVEKRREIAFIKNVKFHLDEVEGLGSFVEIEAIGDGLGCDASELSEQCLFYRQSLGIPDSDLLSHSYSDMLMEKRGLRPQTR